MMSDGAQLGARVYVFGPLYPDQVKPCNPSSTSGDKLQRSLKTTVPLQVRTDKFQHIAGNVHDDGKIIPIVAT